MICLKCVDLINFAPNENWENLYINLNNFHKLNPTLMITTEQDETVLTKRMLYYVFVIAYPMP